MLQKDITKDMKLVNKIFNNIVEDYLKGEKSNWSSAVVNKGTYRSMTMSEYKELKRVKALLFKDYEKERIENIIKMIRVHMETGFNS